MIRIAGRCALGLLALAVGASPGVAATRHRPHHHAAMHHRFAHVARRHRLAPYVYHGATTGYGASAPYYVYGPGGGDAFGDDPIGGPDHVGDGGPGANLGGAFGGGRALDEGVLDGAGVVGGGRR